MAHDRRRVNGANPSPPAAEAEQGAKLEKVSYPFDEAAWKAASQVAGMILPLVTERVTERLLAFENKSTFDSDEMALAFSERVAKTASNVAFLTAQHFVAHQGSTLLQIREAERAHFQRRSREEQPVQCDPPKGQANESDSRPAEQAQGKILTPE